MHVDGDTESVIERKWTDEGVRHGQQMAAPNAGDISHVPE
jgi:hypothetical protein